jgi:cytochrome b pre-mRNA-processing protein 3
MPDGAAGASPARTSKGKQLSFLTHIFAGKRERESYRPLYEAIVNRGRDRAWYAEGQVPDTVNGRFDMIAAVLALTLIRLEAEGERTRSASVLLTELFIDDMDASVRQLGIGDLVVGKHVGRMMSALGGRLAAFRSAIAAGGDLVGPVRRNIFRDAPPSDAAVRFVSQGLERFHAGLRAMPTGSILKGELP